MIVHTMRPTFWFNGQPVRAAGVILWTHNKGHIVRLLRKVNNTFEDIGGKTDAKDRDAIDTAIREVAEETNGKLFSEQHSYRECMNCMYRHIIRSYDVQYNAKSKYLLYRVFVDPTLLKLSMKRFGLYENTEWGVLRHYYKWTHLIPRNLHHRLKNISI
jgi:8-oxo-dGTP pyrophosphatase MutT (NUDIX family)